MRFVFLAEIWLSFPTERRVKAVKFLLVQLKNIGLFVEPVIRAQRIEIKSSIY
jgi:hypothetical protein